MNQPSQYTPGVCNINPTEVRKRRRVGVISAIVGVVGLILFIVLHASWHYYVALFVPFFFSSLGFLQAQHSFCISYAALSKHHADDGDIITIDDVEAHRVDMLKSRMLYLEAFLIAMPLTIACCIVMPLLFN